MRSFLVIVSSLCVLCGVLGVAGHYLAYHAKGDVFEKIALCDFNRDIREAAVERLESWDVLEKIALTDIDASVRKAAMERLSELAG